MNYLDYAATSPLRDAAREAMRGAEAWGNPSALYGPGRQAKAALEGARAKIAAILGANPEEIRFTSGGTESDNWALIGAALAHPDKKTLVLSAIEHHAVLRTAEFLERFGYRLRKVQPNARGIIEPAVVEGAMDDDTLLVSVMLANNEIGTLQPIREIAALARAHGVPMHTDAVQAVGHLPLDVRALNCDLLSLSGHKFGGPRGIGALYIRKGTKLGAFMHGGSQEQGLRSGTENVVAAIGMAAALQDCCAQEQIRIERLRDVLQERLFRISGVRVNGAGAPRLAGHLHVSIQGVDPQLLLIALDLEGVMASAGSACTSGTRDRSHVLQEMGAPEGEADLRLTLGYRTTDADVEQAAERIARVIDRLRR